MRHLLKGLTCRVLVVALMTLTFQTARAGLIGAEQAVPDAQAQRTMMLGVLERGDAASQLQAQGIDPAVARDRIASLTDEEVRTMAGSLHTAPAGADGGTILAVILIAGAVWYFAFRR